ncbi:MAG: serine/threonine protein kinase, partial [Armatimonadota bacterium]|nr:serine/threonine protein kinase [Armatimonadota bacterium]
MARGDSQKYPSEALVRYRLLRETRRGGMSQIWEAIDTQTGRRVVVKRLSVPTTLTPAERRAWIAQIERAAQEIARLKHPNIAAIYDVGQENGQPFLVMDLLPGRTLRQRLREGPLPPGEAVRVLSQAAAALDATHATGLVHGGLKPANVLILPNGTVKLTDFGIARQGESQQDMSLEKTATETISETMIGSPSYLSPEQIHGDALSPASDVWALGVILYEMLAGHPPFSGSRMEAVLEQITTGNPPPAPRMPPAIQAVLS